jgi:hypothetical protein
VVETIDIIVGFLGTRRFDSAHVCCIVKPTTPPDYEERIWKKLQTSIQAIHSGTTLPYSKEELYNVTLGRLLLATQLHTAFV